jgi:hypothetical protein
VKHFCTNTKFNQHSKHQRPTLVFVTAYVIGDNRSVNHFDLFLLQLRCHRFGDLLPGTNRFQTRFNTTCRQPHPPRGQISGFTKRRDFKVSLKLTWPDAAERFHITRSCEIWAAPEPALLITVAVN